MKTFYLVIICLVFFSSTYVYSDKVNVENVVDTKGGKYLVGEMKEGDLFFHDRLYTITNIPKEFLGLTQIKTSCDCPGGQDYNLSFDIDRDAYVYTVWDSRHVRPEKRGQTPKDWFTNGFKDTGKILCLDAPHPTKENYWIYKSVKPYKKGTVELFGIDEVTGDTVIMWTIFLEEGGFSVSPGQKLATTWAEAKMLR